MSLLLFCSTFAHSESKYLWGKVSKIQDGDTVVLVKDDGTSQRVQLAYIDAPDMDKSGKKQSYHSESMTALSNLVKNKEVIIEVFGVDRFKRIEGMIFIGKENMNIAMIRMGMAEIYHPVRANPANYIKRYVTEFKRVEKIAKKERIGIWSQDNYLSPYQFRRLNR